VENKTNYYFKTEIHSTRNAEHKKGILEEIYSVSTERTLKISEDSRV
jgi:hypothetical protein